MLRDEVERIKTENLQLKRKVDKQASLLDTLTDRVDDLEKEEPDAT